MKITTLLLAFLYCSIASATNYYFSNSGNDTNNGISTSTPWQTIDKLNRIFSSLKAGDSVLFKRGDTFYGALLPPDGKAGTSSNRIVLSAYGPGAKPILTGMVTLSGWVSLGGGIYEASLADAGSSINMLTINGVPQGLGRYPNTGYLSYESFSGTTSITDNQLTAIPVWTGAEVVIKKDRWIIETKPITAHSGSTLTYQSSFYKGINGYGYFIQNDPRCLDSFGEWYYDSSDQTVQVYFGEDPRRYTVKASAVQTLVYAAGNSYFTFDNLVFEGSNQHSIHLFWSSYINVQNCDIRYSGGDAITGYGSTHINIENNTINYSHEKGINLHETCNNEVIRNNVIKNTALIPGMCRMGDDPFETSIAVYSKGNNTMIELNTIDSTGYNGIHLKTGNATIVDKNFINNSCLKKDDGGGIYVFSGSAGTSPTLRQITNNIVLNSIGNNEGVGASTATQAQGIYIDGYSKNIDLLNNTVAGCATYGFFFNASKNVNVKGNTAFNNNIQLTISNWGPSASDLDIKNNILFSKSASQLSMYFYTRTATDVKTFGEADSNYYARPLNNGDVFKTEMVVSPFTIKNYTLSEWRSASTKDANSKGSPISLPGNVNTNEYIRFVYNSSSSAKIILLDGTYKDVKGIVHAGQVTLSPFSSLILIKVHLTHRLITMNDSSLLKRKEVVSKIGIQHSA